MSAVVALLRGVNVGGNNKLPMETLRMLCEGLKLRRAATYIQSGNVVFDAPARGSLNQLAERLELAIEAECGFRPAVLLRTAEEMRAVVERNPFPSESASEPNKLVVTFLRQAAPPAYLERVNSLRASHPERIEVRGRECYMYFPAGQGKTKLPLAWLERALDSPSTARNWNSVLKLLEMTGAAGNPGSPAAIYS